MTIDDVLATIRERLQLEAATEYEVVEEIRGHLEESVASGRQRGLDEHAALRAAAESFGLELAADELRAAHFGRGTLDAIALAGLPVIAALLLRWTIFLPDGTVIAWQELLSGPALAIVAAVAILVPLLRFPNRRPALALWSFFWLVSLATVLFPTVRW